MGVSWAFVVLLVYPALQVPLLWVVVRHFDLRNDDGPRDPVGYSLVAEQEVRWGSDGSTAGRCPRCGRQNDPSYEYCRNCVTGL